MINWSIINHHNKLPVILAAVFDYRYDRISWPDGRPTNLYIHSAEASSYRYSEYTVRTPRGSCTHQSQSQKYKIQITAELRTVRSRCPHCGCVLLWPSVIRIAVAVIISSGVVWIILQQHPTIWWVPVVAITLAVGRCRISETITTTIFQKNQQQQRRLRINQRTIFIVKSLNTQIPQRWRILQVFVVAVVASIIIIYR